MSPESPASRAGHRRCARNSFSLSNGSLRCLKFPQ
jgi:hypothetical protein